MGRRERSLILAGLLVAAVAVPAAAASVPNYSGLVPAASVKLYAGTSGGETLLYDGKVSLAHSVFVRGQEISYLRLEVEAQGVDQPYRFSLAIETPNGPVFFPFVRVTGDGHHEGKVQASEIEDLLPAGSYVAKLVAAAEDGWEISIARLTLKVVKPEGSAAQPPGTTQPSPTTSEAGVEVSNPSSDLTAGAATNASAASLAYWEGRDLPPQVREELEERAQRYVEQTQAAQQAAEDGEAEVENAGYLRSKGVTISGWIKAGCRVSRLYGTAKNVAFEPGSYENPQKVYKNGKFLGYRVTLTQGYTVTCSDGSTYTISPGKTVIVYQQPDAANSGSQDVQNPRERVGSPSQVRRCQYLENTGKMAEFQAENCDQIYRQYCQRLASQTPSMAPPWCCMKGYATSCRPTPPRWPVPLGHSMLDPLTARVNLAGFSVQRAWLISACLVLAFLWLKRRWGM